MKQFKSYKTKISIPDNVKIEKKQNNLFFYGPLGSTQLSLEKLDVLGIAGFQYCSNNLIEKSFFLTSNSKRFFACMSNIIQNKIIGVSSGFLISIRIIGVGYRAEIIKNPKNQILCFKIGFSHDLEYVVPSSVRVFLLEPALICLYGVDKNQVTQIAAKIRQIKPPSVYKGKGIRLLDEVVFTKPGKRK
jgi:large subunit ribosomal protein L6